MCLSISMYSLYKYVFSIDRSLILIEDVAVCFGLQVCAELNPKL